METSAGQGEHGTGKSVKGSIRKIPSESVIRLWRNFLRQCLIRGLEVDFCSLPFRKKLYRRSIKNPNPFPIWKIWFGLYAFGAPGRSRTCGLQSRSCPNGVLTGFLIHRKSKQYIAFLTCIVLETAANQGE